MMQLLLFTENTDTRSTVDEILQKENISTTITSVSSHSQTLNQLERNRFDIVVLESTPHPRNSFELLQKIKMRFPSIPVLMLSLNNRRAFAIQAMRLNAQGFLTNDRITSEFADAVKSIRLGRCYMTTELTA